MKISHKTMLIVSCLSVGGTPAFTRSALADLSVTLPALQDVTLFGGSDATANKTGSGPGMFAGSDGASAKRAMIEFGIAGAIPASAHITSATMTLTLGTWSGATVSGTGGDQTPRTIRLYDITNAWNPSLEGTTAGTVTFPSSGFNGTGHGYAPDLGNATWNYAMYNTVPWTNPGGDFSGTESADTVVSEILKGSYSWTSAQMALDVQNWLDGSLTNNGWLLKNDTESATPSYRVFYTREGAQEQAGASGYAPALTVTYTVPEPATLFLLATAAPLLARRVPPRRVVVRIRAPLA